MEARDRILKFLEEINENANSLGRKLGERDGTKIYYIINGRNGISDNLANKIKEQYPFVSVEWLVRGYGEMYERDNVLNSYTSKLKDLYSGKIIVEDNIMEVKIPDPGELFAYTMSGSSMAPDYVAGDVLGCQAIDKDSVIEYGKIHLVKTKNGILVRRIMPDGEGSILLVSNDDKKYPPIKVSLAEIEKLAVVNNYIRRV